jgi:hypothetical protein
MAGWSRASHVRGGTVLMRSVARETAETVAS